MILGLIIGFVIGFAVALAWNYLKPEKFDKTTSRVAKELKEIEDELRGKD